MGFIGCVWLYISQVDTQKWMLKNVNTMQAMASQHPFTKAKFEVKTKLHDPLYKVEGWNSRVRFMMNAT